MTFEQLVTRIRRLARTDSNGASDTVLVQLIEDGLRQFSHDVHGFPKEEYQKVSASFDTNTDYALNVTITGGANAMAATDVVITSTDREDATGAVVAEDLQTMLQAATSSDITVSFTNFYFTLDTTASSQSTAITIAAPDSEDYLDARELLGLDGSLDEVSGALPTGQFTGDFPYGCTRRLTLDRRPISILSVMWDDYVLHQAPRGYFYREDYSGDPIYYYNEGQDLILTPSPSTQKELYISYKAEATLDDYQGYQECGLSSKTLETDTGLSASTAYNFKLTIDGGAQTEYTITTGTNTTFDAVITLMNAEISGAVFSITGGDLRCTSDEIGPDSYIALAAGSATDLFGALTGFSAFETAVAGGASMPTEIEEVWHKAVAFWVAGEVLYENFEANEAQRLKGAYYNDVRNYLVEYGNRNTSLNPREAERLWWRYGGRD